ncbi:carbon-nitrogen hydrolase family protein [Brachybacterium sp. YJGR34]|uniref:carbon-nitrogen hydrolase family protein n=1 Tax=Brachybacterium sp. YJGR34 TaxID=2059911 RepID=UPI000E0A3765|nr:carbon-nitrogen hydrolase family protein [Brachybacterium sp. YJGR34]
MTADRALKKRVRARMARTGESYTAALRHLRPTPGGTVPHQTTAEATPLLRLATAQTTTHQDSADAAAIQRSGDEVRALMRRAQELGAHLVQFPEATLCFPDKRALSSSRTEIAEADWSRFAWDALDAEIATIREETRHLGMWTVLGAPVRTEDGGRPRNSLLVFDPQGRTRARYDERRLSRSKAAFLYERGDGPVTITVRGIVLGLATGLEVLFEDIFLGYEDAGADAVLLSSQGPGDPSEADAFAISARAAARHHGLTLGYSVPTTNAPYAPAGVIGPDGRFAATCPAAPEPAVVVHEVTPRPDGAPRDWRRSMVGAD